MGPSKGKIQIINIGSQNGLNIDTLRSKIGSVAEKLLKYSNGLDF